MTTAAQLGEMIAGYMSGLAWADQVGGIVRAVKLNSGGVEKSFPGIYADQDNCHNSQYVAYIPDDARRSVIYCEDNGTSVTSIDGHYTNYKASVRVVVWLNFNKIDPLVTDLGVYLDEAVRIIPVQVYNYGRLCKIHTAIQDVVADDASIFSRYTYDEAEKQYLTFPFAAFAIDYEITFSTPLSACDDGINLNPTAC